MVLMLDSDNNMLHKWILEGKQQRISNLNADAQNNIYSKHFMCW